MKKSLNKIELYLLLFYLFLFLYTKID